MKAHRFGASLSVESIDECVTRSRSHTSDSISSSTSSTVCATQSNSNYRTGTGTEPHVYTKSPKSPLLTAKFKVGSIKSEETVENGSSEAENVERKLKAQVHNGDEGILEIRPEMNGTKSRSYSSSPLVRMRRVYNSDEDGRRPQTPPVQGGSEIEGARDAAAELAVDSDMAVDGYSPSAKSEQSQEEEDGEKSLPEDHLSASPSNQIESPTPPALIENGKAESSPSSEAVKTDKTTTTERLAVKKEGSDVTSSSESSMSARGSEGTATGGEEASSSTQSSETKDITAEVLINVVPSR